MDNKKQTYLQQLAEESSHLHELKLKSERNDRNQSPRPLVEQITDLMRNQPPALRNRPWTMAELVSRLQGRYRDRPHAQHVGEALRHLGWRPVRLWSNGYSGQRVWIAQQLPE